MRAAVLLVAAACAAGPIGCSGAQPLYRWGHYEALVYAMRVKPEAADPATQIAVLTEDIQTAAERGQRVPPGVHAHLGYMYYLQGNRDAARAEFQAERATFPESAVLVDQMLRRLEQP